MGAALGRVQRFLCFFTLLVTGENVQDGMPKAQEVIANKKDAAPPPLHKEDNPPTTMPKKDDEPKGTVVPAKGNEQVPAAQHKEEAPAVTTPKAADTLKKPEPAAPTPVMGATEVFGFVPVFKKIHRQKTNAKRKHAVPSESSEHIEYPANQESPPARPSDSWDSFYSFSRDASSIPVDGSDAEENCITRRSGRRCRDEADIAEKEDEELFNKRHGLGNSADLTSVDSEIVEADTMNTYFKAFIVMAWLVFICAVHFLYKSFIEPWQMKKKEAGSTNETELTSTGFKCEHLLKS